MKNCRIKINSFFNNKNNLLIFLLLVVGVLIPALSGTQTNNFFAKLIKILTSPLFNCISFFAFSLSMLNFKREFSKKDAVIIRYQNYYNMLKSSIQDLIIFNIYLYVVTFILAISGAVIFCFGDFELIIHAGYQIPLICYIIFFFIRMVLFSTIVQIINYLCSIKCRNYVFIILVVVEGLLFLLLPFKTVSHFYNLPILPQYYFMDVQYASLITEVISTMIYGLILYSIAKYFFLNLSRKRRDVI